MLEFCDKRELRVANSWFQKNEKRKITYIAGGYKTEIYFVLVGKNRLQKVKNVKVVPWKLQHRLVIVDLNKKILNEIVKKKRIMRRRI